MNLLGKIFTFSILVFSIIVLVVAVAVYGTHKNWQTAYNNLQQKYTQAQAANADLVANYQRQVDDLKAEKEATLQDVAKLETERVRLLQENAQNQQLLDQLRQDERKMVATVAATQENNQRLAQEVQALRDRIREAQQARDDAFTNVLNATTDLHVTAGQLQQLQERHSQVVADLADKTARLSEGASADGEFVPHVRGKISSTRRADGNQLIEITVGADDGLKPGHTVEIFRGERYLGRAEILRTEPDRAVGQVLRQFQQGQIQEDDDVATRLRVG
ncbi:MAG: hypothetical protein DCC67_11665 [Planctomycetota bacterium]|nr:MAG: hypothetical protein DCC67_11665 [Planctomycetota bacterium]